MIVSNRSGPLNVSRYPEVLGAKRRASKGDGPGTVGASAASFEARHSASKTR